MGKKKVRCVVGPLLLPPAKMELWNAVPENAQTLIEAGCLGGARRRTLLRRRNGCPGISAFASPMGWMKKKPSKASPSTRRSCWASKTKSVPWKRAKTLDVAIFDGHPFSNMTHCVLTMIDGEIYHNKM